MKMKHKKVWILSGVPGSGKSTWARNRVAQFGGTICSRDEIRFSLLKDGEDYFSHEDEVWALLIEKITTAITNPEVNDIYIDATHLTEKAREKLFKELPKDVCFITTVFFDVPLETCIERNDNRSGRAFVPHSVIRRMYASYERNTKLGDATLHLDENGEWRGIN